MKSDLDLQQRFELGMQFYRDALEQEQVRFRRTHPVASVAELEQHLTKWHLKPQEWVDPAFRLRRPPL